MSASDKDRAGDLLIQEVDEELRREQLKKLWQRYGGLAVALAVAIIVGVAGYQGWQTWQARQRLADSRQYAEAESLIAQGKNQDALTALNALAQESRTGYALAARMAAAELKARTGDAKGAAAAYHEIATSSAPELYRGLAVLKETLVAAEAGLPVPEEQLTQMVVAGNPWYYEANELLAMIASQKGDTARAIGILKQLSDDSEAPRGVRARATQMLAALGGAPAETPEKPKG